MPYLLYITVSPQGDNSLSRGVGNVFLESFKASHPDSEVIVRDLSTNPVPHLDGEALFAGYVPEESRSESQAAKHQHRLDLIKEVSEASHVTIATPMWNWSVPSVLKAWIDQLVMPGVFDPYHNRKLEGKKVTIIVASGNSYIEGSANPSFDHEVPYLKFILERLGATDINVIRSEYGLAGIVPGMEGLVEAKEKSFADAKAAATARAESL